MGRGVLRMRYFDRPGNFDMTLRYWIDKDRHETLIREAILPKSVLYYNIGDEVILTHTGRTFLCVLYWSFSFKRGRKVIYFDK